MIKVGVVILEYKNSVDTIECVKSLRSASKPEYDLDIILVDNSGTNVYLDEIISKCNVDHIISVANDGYAAGNNVGIQRAINNQDDYIIVINNDTIVDKEFVEPLIRVLKENKFRMAAPLIYNYFTNEVWSSGGRFRKKLADFCMTNDLISENRKTAFASGCCFAVSSELFKMIGLLKEDYFMYCEDSEFCKRLTDRNGEIIVVPDSVIYHKVSVSSGANSPFQMYYLYRNQIYFSYTEFTGFYKLYAVTVNILKALYKSFLFLFRNKKECFKALLFAIKDGKNIIGKRRY